jgi:hypothetical protein
MAPKTKFLRLESLVAYRQSERDGDEIFIKYKDEKIAPKDAKFLRLAKDPLTLNVEIELDNDQKWVELELWDYDRFSPDDSLGKFKLLVDQVAETFTAELVREKDSDGKYILNWSVIERSVNKAAKPRK